MQNQPIVILSDNQQIQTLFQLRLKQQEQKQYRMLSKNQQIRQYQLSKIQGNTKEQKETNYISKLIQYFKEGTGIDLYGNFQPKFTPDYEAEGLEFEENSLVVYGVDFMSTARVVKYFRYFEPNIDWINDSSCKVTFSGKEKVEKVIREYETRGKGEGEGGMEEEGISNRQWYELREYLEFSIPKKIEARVCTNQDKALSEEARKEQNKYTAYEFLKNKLLERIETEMREVNKLGSFEGPRRRECNGDDSRHRRIRKVHRDHENHKERRDRDQGFRGRDRDRGGRGRGREGRNGWRNDRQRSQQNYSFDNRGRREQSPEPQQDYSFDQRGAPYQPIIEDDKQSRRNFSFAQDSQIKEQSEMADVNMSFNPKEIEKSMNSLLEDLNLSFRKVNLSQVVEENIILIDD